MQKALRRGDAETAGYFGIELFMSGYPDYTWRRLLTISAEDCWGLLTAEIESLYRACQDIRKHNKKDTAGRVFLAKAIILIALAKKSRDADHLTNLVYDESRIDIAKIEAELMSADIREVPSYAFDIHTKKGRKAGKTKTDFFNDEHKALTPRQAGLFDHLID